MDLDNALEFDQSYRFSDLFVPNSSCNLRTLELGYVAIDGGFRSFGFPMLTTLRLECCPLSFGEGEDLFSNFPCLQHLAFRDCIDDIPYNMREMSFKVHGLQLLSLDLQRIGLWKIEIVAPKLKLFYFSDDWDQSSEFPELSLPSLDYAWIYVSPECEKKMNKEWVEQNLMSLFQGLHNAETLTLYGVIQVMSAFDEVLEKQPSPFTRLKHLQLRANDIPYKVVDYFLSGSCSAEPIVEFLNN